MFEANSQILTITEALDWYVREFLVGKKRDRTIAEYRKDLEHLFAELPVDDIDLESTERRVLVRRISSKSRKDRLIYLSAETTRALAAYLRAILPCSGLFPQSLR